MFLLSPRQCGKGHRRSFSLAIAQRRARPCGSTIRKKTISEPKVMSSACETAAVEMVTPTRLPSAGRNWLRKIGRMTLKAPPKKLPRIEPMPPMMTMNSSWKERSTENAAGSHEPRCTKPHSAPATPTKKELTAKAESFEYIGRIPITSAATSMSRIAIHWRPMVARVRFLAIRAKRTMKPRQNRYFSTGASMVQPNSSRFDTETEPEEESLVNHLIRRKAQSQKNWAAKVATAR